jgi:sialate O-acetylesterase
MDRRPNALLDEVRNAVACIRFRGHGTPARRIPSNQTLQNRSRAHHSVFKAAVFFAVLLVPPGFARAEVSLDPPITEHMLVQRGLPVHIWGKSGPGEAVSVTFRGETRPTTADANGRWGVYLSPGEAGGPFDMTIKGSNEISFKDVLVGDVWVASGQSNMEFSMNSVRNAESEIAAAIHPNIRLLHVERRTSEYPLEDIVAKPWTGCSPESVRSFSAVAYFFGLHLHQNLHVPIGLIETSWGGTPAEAWTSLNALSADSSLMPVFVERARQMKDLAARLIAADRQMREYDEAAARAKAEGKPAPPRPSRPDLDSHKPSALYNAMLAPLTPFPIRGAIWYQGETNASARRAPIYARLLETMIVNWRDSWDEGDFPFLIVQLANFNAGPNNAWPELRDAQRQALALNNTGLAVTIDIGEPNDIHPKNKQDVGLRLALAARAIAYGEKIEYSGPLYRQVTSADHALRVWFDHVDGGLVAKGGSALKGFEITGADRKFQPADARIDGQTVLVTSSAVPSPVYVRYGWADNPDVNLYNAAGLPASPFQSGQ